MIIIDLGSFLLYISNRYRSKDLKPSRNPKFYAKVFVFKNTIKRVSGP